ncbi:MAG: hypothetical protein RIB46_12610 [Pseudomonadales bacterium]
MSGRDDRAAVTLAGEEAVGAELLAGRELLALAGVALATAEGVGRLLAEQGGFWLDDQRRTAATLARGATPQQAGAAVVDHVSRRVRHLTAGADQLNRLLFEQTRQACRAAATLWQPYLAVVSQDWRQTRPDP